jgi:hypothetical protein
MACELRVLAMVAGTEPTGLVAEAGAAIAATGSWQRSFEVRMGAGPAVTISGGDDAGYLVAISWGSQYGRMSARALPAAIECADRLAHAFYQSREARLVRD